MAVINFLKNLNKVALLLLFLLVFFIALSPPQDADMWWHLAAGKKMVEKAQILTTDTFSYTHQGDNWTNAFWISDIILFLVYGIGSYPGITLLVAAMAVLTMGVIYGHEPDSPFAIRAFAILLGMIAIAPVWTPRPQLFSFLILAILDYGLNSTNAFLLKRPWLLPLLFLLWANIHGGFIWGFLLMLAFLAGRGLDSLLKRENSLPFQELNQVGIWTVVAAVAIAINPNGLSLWRLPFYTVDVSIQSISEWYSPDFHRLDLHPLLWLLFLLLMGTGTSRNALPWSSVLKVVGFSYMAFISQRSMGPFVIVTIPVVIHSLTHLWREWQPFFSRFGSQRQPSSLPTAVRVGMNLLILGMLAGVTILRVYSVSADDQVHRGLPAEAVEAIRIHQPKAQMFNSYNWGGYLQWQLPEYPVFIDGRADLYGEKTINEWWSVVNGTEEGLRLLDDRQVNFVILEPGWPILEQLAHKGWKILYEDDTAVVMQR